MKSRACSSTVFNFLFGNNFKVPKSHNENYKEHLYPCPHLLYYSLTLSPSPTFFSLELPLHTHHLFLPLNSTWASLMAQLVKNPPAMQETWVWSLSWAPGEGKGYPTPVFWPGEFHGLYSHKELDTTEQLLLSLFTNKGISHLPFEAWAQMEIERTDRNPSLLSLFSWVQRQSLRTACSECG